MPEFTPPPSTTISSADTASQCVECLRQYPAGELLQLRGGAVCAECKPAAVAKIASDQPLGTFWRKGRVLVVVRTKTDVEFPARCVVCNTCASTHWQNALAWDIPWVWWFLVPLLWWLSDKIAAFFPLLNSWGSVIFVVLVSVVGRVATGFSKEANYHHKYVLCDEHWERQYHRVKLLIVVGYPVLLGIVALVAYLFSPRDVAFICGMSAVVLAIIWPSLLVAWRREVKRARQTATHSFFKGCGAEFLAEFPEWRNP